jgi:hypothetical protein
MKRASAQFWFVVARIGVRPLGQNANPRLVCRAVTGLYRAIVSGHFLIALDQPALERIQCVSAGRCPESG